MANLKDFAYDTANELSLELTSKTGRESVKTNLRKLDRLGILCDEVIYTLLAQAPIDPAGVYQLCEPLGNWVFNPLNFSMARPVVSNGEQVGSLEIDLLSSDMFFNRITDGKVVVAKSYNAEELIVVCSKFQEDKKDSFLAWVNKRISALTQDVDSFVYIDD